MCSVSETFYNVSTTAPAAKVKLDMVWLRTVVNGPSLNHGYRICGAV